MQLFWPRRLSRAVPALRAVATVVDGLVVRIIWRLGDWLGPERSVWLFGGLFALLGRTHSKSEKVGENLRLAFPEKTKGEIDALTREVWRGAGALIGEYPNLSRIATQFEQRVEIVILGKVAAFSDPQRPAIFVTAHYGAWELSLLLAGHFGVPLTAMYNFDFLHSNPQIARRVEASRESLACELIPRQSGVRPLVRALSERRSLGLVVDYRFDDCEPIPFFERDAYTTTLPARLALRFGCELVPVRVDRKEPGQYRITVYPPVTPVNSEASSREQARQMTRKINQHFESWIRERPGQWLCMKRRWPKAEVRETEPLLEARAQS